MRILVIDDNPLHQQSARQTLKDHDVTIATSYESAFRILTPLDDNDYVSRGEKGECYDVVLTDLLMPASGMMLSEEAKEKYEGVEQPLGWALLLRAILNGARYGAVASNGCHHDHPAGYAMDTVGYAVYYGGPDWRLKPQFEINGAKVGFFNKVLLVPVEGTVCDTCHNAGVACDYCKDSGMQLGKDWGFVLNALVDCK